LARKILIVGLGNPGKKYKNTRHNLGFAVLDLFATVQNCSFKKSKFSAELADFKVDNDTIILAKPKTFMNNSGQAVSELINFHKNELEDLLIVYDDADLPLGKIRLRSQGGTGGHNGMASIRNHLKTQNFARLRLGINSDLGRYDMVSFVLSPFAKEERPIVDEMIKNASRALSIFISQSINDAMNAINTEI
jgi:peptidyl-tRNA hydrolase, PTH1 family